MAKLQFEPQPVDNEQMLKFEYMLNNGELEKRYSPEKFARAKQKIEAWQKVFYADTLPPGGPVGKGFAGGSKPPGVAPTPGRGPLVEPPDTRGVPFAEQEVVDVEPTEAEAAKPLSAWEALKAQRRGKTAGAFSQDYQTELRFVRPSAYIPGLGAAPVEDGEWWQKKLAELPGGARDKILGASTVESQAGALENLTGTPAGIMGEPGASVQLTSRGPVWLEPSDEEAAAAVRADREAMGLRPKDSAPHLKRWKDQKWQEAYDAAKKEGRAIYRARDISSASPKFLQQAKANAEYSAEPFLRQLDKGTTMGAVGAAIDTGVEGAKYLGRAPFEYFGVEPPSFLEPDPTAQAQVQRNLQRGSRAVEQSPGTAAAGAVAGMVVPGMGSVLGKGATRGIEALVGETAGRGIASGMAKHGAASALGAGIEQLGTSRLQSEVQESAGLPEIPWSQSMEEAGLAAGMGSVVGATLGVPSGMSRGMRETDSPTRSAMSALGPDSTTLRTSSGLKTPEGHEALSKANPAIGAHGAARSDAVKKATDVFMQKGAEADAARAARAAQEEAGLASKEAELTYNLEGTVDDLMARQAAVNRQAGEMSEAVVGNIQAEGQDFLENLQSLSTDIVDSSSLAAKQTEEEALRFSDRFIRRAQGQRDAMLESHLEKTQEAYQAHGAPPPMPIPGPDMHISALEQMRMDAPTKPDYPTVSTAPIVDEISNILADISLDDGTHFPTSSHKKLKDMFDSLVVKRTMTPEEAADYKSVFYDAKVVEEPGMHPSTNRGQVTFITTKDIHVRELDNLIQVTDEAAKYPDSASPDAERYRRLGAVMRKARDAGFPLLGKTKAEAHLDLLETERMLRAIGLPANAGELDPQNIDQVRIVHENIKALAKTPRASIDGGDEVLKTPEGLAVPVREFEQWLSKYDPGLFDTYASMRRLHRQQAQAQDFDITMRNTPMGRAKSLKLVEAALLGKDHDAAGVLESFKSYGARVEAMRQQEKRVGGLFEALGADKNMKSMSDFQRMQYKVGANEFFLQGGPRFEYIREKMPPEFRERMDQVRNAAVDIDAMFRAAGFGPSRKDMTRDEMIKKLRSTQKAERAASPPTWGNENFDELMRRQDNTRRSDVTKHLHTIFKGYQKHGGDKNFDELVNKTFEEHPDVLAALKRMTEERAFGWLRRMFKGDEAVEIFGAKQAWYAAASDFIQNHVDALVAHEGGKKNWWFGNANPLDVPAPYAMGVVAPSENDPNREAEVTKMSGVKAMEALFRAVELMQAKEKQP